MRKYLNIILCSFLLFQSCATVKSFFSKKSIIDPDDPNFLNNIQKLRSSYQNGDVQALEEMIQIYNDEDQHIKARIEAGRMLANTQHPMALNAIAKMVETTSAVDFSFLKSSIEMLSLFRENPKASFAMVESMHILEERTNNQNLFFEKNLIILNGYKGINREKIEEIRRDGADLMLVCANSKGDAVLKKLFVKEKDLFLVNCYELNKSQKTNILNNYCNL